MQVNRNLKRRDFLGRLCPTMEKENKCFYVTKRDSGKYVIISSDRYIASRAIIGDWPFWDITPDFDSMIQAAAFMVNHIYELN